MCLRIRKVPWIRWRQPASYELKRRSRRPVSSQRQAHRLEIVTDRKVGTAYHAAFEILHSGRFKAHYFSHRDGDVGGGASGNTADGDISRAIGIKVGQRLIAAALAEYEVDHLDRDKVPIAAALIIAWVV